MESIKGFFNSIWGWVAGAATLVFGIGVYYINMKQKQVADLQAKIDLADTQKKADLIETEIKAKMDQKDMYQKEVDKHEELLANLDDKRKEIAEQEKNRSVDEVEKYWSK